jgi:hypothetical protein
MLGPGGKLSLLAGKYEHFIYFTKKNSDSKKDINKLRQKRPHESESGEREAQPFKKQKTSENKATIKTSELDVKLNEDKEDVDDLKAEFGDQIIEEINNSQHGTDQASQMATTSAASEAVQFEPLKCSQWEEAPSGTLLIYSTAGLVAREKVNVTGLPAKLRLKA